MESSATRNWRSVEVSGDMAISRFDGTTLVADLSSFPHLVEYRDTCFGRSPSQCPIRDDRVIYVLGVANDPQAEFGRFDRVVRLTRCDVRNALGNRDGVIGEALVEAGKQRDVDCGFYAMRPIR
jgi:hypothetical protein